MNKVSDYTKKINTFGKALVKMVETDFPTDPGIADEIESVLATLQYKILGAFLKKGEYEK